jgi:hypothetical protein
MARPWRAQRWDGLETAPTGRGCGRRWFGSRQPLICCTVRMKMDVDLPRPPVAPPSSGQQPGTRPSPYLHESALFTLIQFTLAFAFLQKPVMWLETIKRGL